MTDETVTPPAARATSRRGGLGSISLRVLAGSAVLAVAASAVAYGLLSDSGLITGNQATTGDRVGGQAVLDVQIAQSIDARCDQGDLSWQEASIPAVFDQGVSVSLGDHDYWSSNFCVRLNPATSSLPGAFAYLSVENLIETDPTCSPGESAAGDPDCGTAASGTGELAEVIFWSVYASSPDCWNIQFSPSGTTPIQLVAGTTNGAFVVNSNNAQCVAIRLSTGMNSDDPHLDTAQSDSVTWDWRFNASE